MPAWLDSILASDLVARESILLAARDLVVLIVVVAVMLWIARQFIGKHRR